MKAIVWTKYGPPEVLQHGRYRKKVRTPTGDITIEVPRDRNGESEPQIIAHQEGVFAPWITSR